MGKPSVILLFVFALLFSACAEKAATEVLPVDGDPESEKEREAEADSELLVDGDPEKEASVEGEESEEAAEADEAPENEREAEPEGEIEPESEMEADTEQEREEEVVRCSQALVAPRQRLWPVPGELMYIQVGLAGFSMGESGLLIGPDGSLVLFDAGNNSHDDDIRALLNQVIAQMNTTTGFAKRQADSLDQVILTHYHADHVDGLQDLLSKVALKGHVVSRGLYDITRAVEAKSVEAFCSTLATLPAGSSLALCTGPAAAPCSLSGTSGEFSSSACPGLSAGNLLSSGGTGRAYLPLGSEARVEFLAVDGRTAAHSFEAEKGPLLRDDSNGENARSVVSLIRHGYFRFLHGGDLTGGGSDTDAVEGFYIASWGFDNGLDALGVDVLHLGHHGRNTSSSLAWLDALLPKDGLSRNALIAVSKAHLGSPHAEVLANVALNNRLNAGAIWTNTVTVGGASHALLRNAQEGHIVLATQNGGRSYTLQAIAKNGAVLFSESTYSVAYCAETSERR